MRKNFSGYLNEGCVIKGSLFFEGVYRLEGTVEGDIKGNGSFFIGKTGKVKGKLDVDFVSVEGVVEGEIVALERVEILKGGRVEGEIKSPNVRIAEGAFVKGYIDMSTQVKVSRISEISQHRA